MTVSDAPVEDAIGQLQDLLRQKRFGAFGRLLNGAIQQHGHSAALCRLTLDYAQLTDKPAVATQALMRWCSLEPANAEPLVLLASHLAQQRAYDLALEALDLAQQAGLDPLSAARRRACILLMAGRWAEAAESAGVPLSQADEQPAQDSEHGTRALVTPAAHLLEALRTLAGNLAAAAGRTETADWAIRVAGRAGCLEWDASGLALASGEGLKRLTHPAVERASVEEAVRAAKTTPTGCVVGSSLLLDLADQMALVHDGTTWGMRMRVYVLEGDEERLTLALADRDARRLLSDEAVTWLVGPDATSRFAQLLEARPDEPPVRIHIGHDALGPQTPYAASGGPSVQQVADAASEAASRRLRTWYEQAAAYYALLPREHWADVLGDSPSRPPRILFITTEFSSYMRFAIRDLAATFEGFGWQTRVLKETHPTQRITGPTVARAVAEFLPDLIWQINYLRSNWRGVVPDGVPFVGWDQDAMPHLLSAEQGRMMGKFDFLACLGSGVGFIRRYLYPPEQVLALSMGVDRAIFTPEPALPPQTDVCYVSHHGWTLTQQIDRTLADSGQNDPRARHLLQECARDLEGLFARVGHPIGREASDALLEAVCARLGVSPPGPARAALGDYLHRTLANAIWRHQTVQWVAQAGVTLRLYGMGWDQNPQFARFAAGVVEHGRPLRDVFASSRVALQAVLAGNEHQRLWEAAASGTPVLMRYHPLDESFAVVRRWLDRLEAGAGRPLDQVIPASQRCDEVGRFSFHAIQVLAAPDGLVSPEVLACVRRMAATPCVRDKLGGVYDEVAFRTPDELQSKLARILADEPFRQQLREKFLQGAELHDYRVQIPRLIRQIRQRLLA